MTRFVSPAIDQLEKLRQPLTSGERMVVDLFHAELPEDWEIYIQPHLNGLRPDIVLLNPKVGIAVFEVKDWDLGAMEYWVEERAHRGPILLARKDGKEFSLQSQNPIEKVFRYKQEIHELYCPRLNARAGFATITAGVIFPFSPRTRVFRLLEPCLKHRGMLEYPRYNPVSGMEAVASGNLREIFPEVARHSSSYMSSDQADDLRNWLVEPDVSVKQRQALELDDNQKSFVMSRTESGYRRIKGPAGSGKSIVLAARAAQLLSEGKEVLVVSYNITLLHYLMDVAVRWGNGAGATRKGVTWLNFHAWCKRICGETDHDAEYSSLWRGSSNETSGGKDSILSVELPQLVSRCIEHDRDGIVPRFDAILVDEGQDFLPSWWNVLRQVCLPGGEMLLVADATQDVYGTARSWTDEAMTGAGFRGGWAELKISYRLPPTALRVAREFATTFLPDDTVSLPEGKQGELEFFPCSLKWVQCSPEQAVDVCLREVMGMAPDAAPKLLSIADITFLTRDRKFGRKVVSAIGMNGVRSVHTFGEDDRDSRRKKMGFYMGDARIKATTLHSFKGWESRALVIFIGATVDQKALALIYTGLTRVKRHTEGSFLTVISCANELKEYGRTWPKYEEMYVCALQSNSGGIVSP